MIQGSEEWRLARAGKVTASRVADVVARTKSGYSSCRANYMAELVLERLTGLPADRFVSGPMEWGTEHEAAARETFSAMEGIKVEPVGLIDHPNIPMAAASPDGIVARGSLGILEIKCPNTSTHIETLLSETIPAKYITQMTWQAACVGCLWGYFISYDPRVPLAMQYFCKHVDIDPTYVRELEDEVRKFLAGLDAKVEALQAKFGRAA